MPNSLARQAQGDGYAPRGGTAGGGTGPSGTITVAPTDFEAFERILKEVNAAWSRQDLPALQRLSTPEMAGYFSRDLSDLDRPRLAQRNPRRPARAGGFVRSLA